MTDIYTQLSHIITPSVLTSIGVPTASIALLQDGKISTHILTTGSHTADDQTLYQACSISKAIAALAVARLVDQGKLSWTTKVQDHLPQKTIDIIVDQKTKHLFPLVTVGMLLSHTSGLSQHGFAGYESSPPSPPSPSQILSGTFPANTPKVRFESYPGAQWSYSGGGFVVLQLFLESLLSQPFPDIMHELVLDPLDMTRSFYGALPQDDKNHTEPYMTAHTPARAGHHTLPEMAAGGLWTTPSDLLKAISAVQTACKHSTDFLTAQTAQALLSPQASGSIGEPAGIWSHGWAVTPSLFGHAGSNHPGYRCYAFGSFAQSDPGGFPAQQVAATRWPANTGLAIMTNSVCGEELIPRMLNALLYLLNLPDQPSFPSWMGGLEKAFAVPKESEDGWKDWIGVWSAADKEWTVSELSGGKPGMSFEGGEGMHLVPAAAPVERAGEGKDVYWFVVDGLEVGVKLMWERDERVVRVMQDQSEVLRKRR